MLLKDEVREGVAVDDAALPPHQQARLRGGDGAGGVLRLERACPHLVRDVRDALFRHLLVVDVEHPLAPLCARNRRLLLPIKKSDVGQYGGKYRKRDAHTAKIR
eukprot:8931904-Pyramimonas_sp.AAC.1